MDKFYYRGSSLNFQFHHHARDINYKYEVDILLNGHGMDPIIIVGDCLLVMAGGAKFLGMRRKDIGRMKVNLSLSFSRYLALEKHGRTDTFSCTQSWM